MFSQLVMSKPQAPTRSFWGGDLSTHPGAGTTLGPVNVTVNSDPSGEVPAVQTHQQFRASSNYPRFLQLSLLSIIQLPPADQTTQEAALARLSGNFTKKDACRSMWGFKIANEKQQHCLFHHGSIVVPQQKQSIKL